MINEEHEPGCPARYPELGADCDERPVDRGGELIRKETRERVERQLRIMVETFGLPRIADVMDGAQEAVMEWVPAKYDAPAGAGDDVEAYRG